MSYFFCRIIVKLALFLRYRIHVQGLNEIIRNGTRGILFLPNHPALIDPVIMSSVLASPFRTRAVIDEKQVRSTILKHLQNTLRFFILPDMGIAGYAGHDLVIKQLNTCIEALKNGDNLLLYPAGRLYRSKLEKLRGNGGVARILSEYPEVRIVLARTKGLWGSDFGRAKGYQGSFGTIIKSHLKHILLNGFFFGPRRDVTIEFTELPADFPRQGGKEEINRYLENYYNQASTPNTYVPYTWFESGGVRFLPEPDSINAVEDTSRVPAEVREKIYSHLREITDKKILKESDTLGTDLGLDSLAIAEIHVWIQNQFGQEISSQEGLRTVASLLLAAIGESSGVQPIVPIPPKWFIHPDRTPLSVPPCSTITDALLYNAKLHPDRPLFADQAKGMLTFRSVILAIFALKPALQAIPGERVGFIMPASSIATVVYLALLYAGKIPVMLNWTVGLRNLKHCLESTGVETIVTSQVVIEKLQGKGAEFTGLFDKFLYLEEISENISMFRKLSALLRSKFCWSSLRRAKVQETAAIIFTSGSESMPKAVPLTHANVMKDLISALKHVHLYRDDCLLGILPPFHSFGLLLNVVFPVCTGIRVAYHANPMEGDMLARLIAAYKATLAVATPTFVLGFLRNATPEQMSSLQLVITGAEKCPDYLRNMLHDKAPQAIIIEGYGITECGPIVALDNVDSTHPGTVGTPLDCLEWRITDEGITTVLETGRTGMLIVRGPSVFGGYLNYDGPSPFVQFEGQEWYKTGDLVSADNEGNLTFQGRLKRFVKIGGEMISLPAIEEILKERFPNPDPQAKGPCLAVEATGDDQECEITLFTTLDNLDRQEVNQVLRAKGFAPISFIKRIVILPEIPLLGSGKTNYRLLKQTGNQP